MNQALFRFPLALLLTGILAWSATASVSGNAGFTVAFQASSSTVAEDVGTVFLTLVLAGPAGQTLTSPVDATVSHLDGTATDGVDLEILVATVTFATGSAPGAQQSVSVRVIDDPVKETDERARLEIGAVTGGVSAGATPIHALKITNDDAQVWSVRFDGTFAGGNGSSVDEGGAPLVVLGRCSLARSRGP